MLFNGVVIQLNVYTSKRCLKNKLVENNRKY